MRNKLGRAQQTMKDNEEERGMWLTLNRCMFWTVAEPAVSFWVKSVCWFVASERSHGATVI